MKMKYVFLIVFSFIYTQGLNIYMSEIEKNFIAIEAIKENVVKEELFLFPVINKNKKKEKINFLSNLNNNLFLEPIMAFRYSNAAFEIDNQNIPSDVIWITPGFHLEAQIPVFYSFTSTWLYLWADFYKHAAYGFGGEKIDHGKTLFKYNPLYSIEYYEPVEESFKGVEFDRGQGGIALLNPNFNIIMGKLNSNLGPFFRDNLSISSSSPPFQQFRINKKFESGNKKINFTYLVGSLFSSIIDSSLLNSFYIDNDENIRRPNVERYVALHRVDINLKSNLRIGVYEKIIFGARNIPLDYLNPLIPFWSVQHSLGDLDNLIMGIDFTYLYKKMRFVGAFFMDEWDPYKTFDNNNRNWFGYQIGFSALPDYFNNKIFIKFEYSKLDPRVYNHRFEINIPSHHNYNLGFWTGGHAKDIWASLVYLINDYSFFDLVYEHTQIGEQNIDDQYNNINIEFLNGEIKTRTVSSLSYSNNKLKYFDYKISLKSYNTHNLKYNKDNFFETSFSLLYNIPN